MTVYGYSEEEGLVAGDSLGIGAFELDEDTYMFCKENMNLLEFKVDLDSLRISIDRKATAKLRARNVNYVILDGCFIYDDELPLIERSGGFYYTRSGDLFEGSAAAVMEAITDRNYRCFEQTNAMRNVQTLEELRACMT